MEKIIKVAALSVVSSREGFRRTDRAWGTVATTVKLSDLTEEEIALLKGEPMLTVTEVEIDETVYTPDEILPPADDAERIAVIVAAIGQLDKANKVLWTNSGTPKTDGIAAITGWPVAAKDRDAAWAQIQSAE